MQFDQIAVNFFHDDTQGYPRMQHTSRAVYCCAHFAAAVAHFSYSVCCSVAALLVAQFHVSTVSGVLVGAFEQKRNTHTHTQNASYVPDIVLSRFNSSSAFNKFLSPDS